MLPPSLLEEGCPGRPCSPLRAGLTGCPAFISSTSGCPWPRPPPGNEHLWGLKAPRLFGGPGAPDEQPLPGPLMGWRAGKGESSPHASTFPIPGYPAGHQTGANLKSPWLMPRVSLGRATSSPMPLNLGSDTDTLTTYTRFFGIGSSVHGTVGKTMLQALPKSAVVCLVSRVKKYFFWPYLD